MVKTVVLKSFLRIMHSITCGSILQIERNPIGTKKMKVPAGSRQPRECSEPEDPSHSWGLYSLATVIPTRFKEADSFDRNVRIFDSLDDFHLETWSNAFGC